MPENNKDNEKVFYRSFLINREAVNEEKRTVELSFSSEEKVERWFGFEILDHNKKSVDLTRLNNSGALLLDHAAEKQIGVIEKAYIDETEKKGKAVVRFSRSRFAEDIFQDVLDGIRKNVSVGYRIDQSVLEETKDDIETYRIKRWTPFEISIVSVPADFTVGVGRNDNNNDIVKKKKEAGECQRINITLKV